MGSAGSWRNLEKHRDQISAARLAERRGVGSVVDQQQNEQIKALQRENEALELCVATLARLLMVKGIVTHDEFDSIAALIDQDK